MIKNENLHRIVNVEMPWLWAVRSLWGELDTVTITTCDTEILEDASVNLFLCGIFLHKLEEEHENVKEAHASRKTDLERKRRINRGDFSPLHSTEEHQLKEVLARETEGVTVGGVSGAKLLAPVKHIAISPRSSSSEGHKVLVLRGEAGNGFSRIFRGLVQAV